MTNPMTLTARAYRSDLDPSPAASGFFGLLDYESTVVTTFAGSTKAGFTNGLAAIARFSHPEGLCLDAAGNLYVADSGNNVVREISTTGVVTTYTNTAGQSSSPMGICVDSAGNIYVADVNNNRVCKVTTNGIVTNLASLSPVAQLATDSSGNVYVGTWASVDKISPHGNVVQVAGTRINSIYNWGSYVGVGVDAAGYIYATTDNHIWLTDPAGNNASGFSDGPALAALFTSPQDAVIDLSYNAYVSEIARVRRIAPDGWVSTMAGTGVFGYQNGRGSMAQFNGADGLCTDTNGNIYVADFGNNCVREISPDTFGIGIADWWQLKYFGRIGIDPNSDPDNNGMTAYEDFWAGLDPTNPASIFKIEGATARPAGTKISWDSVLGKSYAVQWSPDLVSWYPLASSIGGTGSIISYTDLTAGAQTSQRFYRILVIF